MTNVYALPIAVGEIKAIELVEMGAAGYLWDLTSLDLQVASVVGDHNGARNNPNAIGGFTRRTVTFKGVAAGITTISQKRPWSNETAGTCTITCG